MKKCIGRLGLVLFVLFGTSVGLCAQEFAFTIPPGATTIDQYNRTQFAIDTLGNFYLLNKTERYCISPQYQVIKLNSQGQEVLRFGSTGSEMGQLQRPTGIVVDGDGNIYVYDSGNARVQKFDSSGGCLLSFVVDVAHSYRLFLDGQNKVYLAAGPIVKRYSSNGLLEFSFEPDPSYYYPNDQGNSWGPNISIDAQGMIYLHSSVKTPPAGPSTRIVTFSPSGIFLRQVSIPYLSSWFCLIPPSAPTDSPSYYMGDFPAPPESNWPVTAMSVIHKVNVAGAFLSEFSMPHPHSMITACVADEVGNLYLADDLGGIHKINEIGADLLSIGGGPETGRFLFPDPTAIDAHGDIYVLDMMNYRIQKFNGNGTFLLTFGSSGDGEGQFNSPCDLDVGPDGNVYVLDDRLHQAKIMKFRPSGFYLGYIDAPSYSLGNVIALEVDGRGNSFLFGIDGLAKISPAGDLVSLVSFPGKGVNYENCALAVGSSGLVYALIDMVKCYGSYIFVYDPSLSLVACYGNMDAPYHDIDVPYHYFPFGPISGIDLDGHDDLYVADSSNSCIHVINPAGVLTRTFSSAIPGESGIFGMSGITVDCPGNIIVSDAYRNRIQVFKLDPNADLKTRLQSDIDSDGLDDACDPCPIDPGNSCNPAKSGTFFISPEGGIVSTPDGSINITFLPGAVNSSTSFSITDSGKGSLFELTTDQGIGKALYAVTISPEGMTFNTPVTIRFYWSDTDNNGVVDGTPVREADLRISKNGILLTPPCTDSPGTCNLQENYFEVQVSSFSDFALLAINHPPIAGSQEIFTNENTSVNLTLCASDDDGDTLTYEVVTAPAHGTLTGSGPDMTYVPDVYFSGSEAFTFKANDGLADSNIGTVSITVKVVYAFSGFSSPVDNPPIVNVAKAGQSIPVKWRISRPDGTPIIDPSSFKSLISYAVGCDGLSDDPATEVEEYTTGSSGLQNVGDGYWQFNWQTSKTYAGKCRMMVLTLADGNSYKASFRFK